MAALSRAVVLITLFVSAAEGHLRNSPQVKPGNHQNKHHRHHKVHESSSVNTKAAGDGYEGIQKKLIAAWKQKSHMAKLRQTLEAEEKLLASQQSLAETKVDEGSSAAENQQMFATANMIKDAKVLLHNSRQDALDKTQMALKEAYSLKKAAERQLEESKAAILKATEAKEAAIKKNEQIQKVIHAATEEAKYFFGQEVPKLDQKAKVAMEHLPAAAPEQKAAMKKKIVEQASDQKPQQKVTPPEAPAQQSAHTAKKDQQVTKVAVKPSKVALPEVGNDDEQIDELGKEIASAGAD